MNLSIPNRQTFNHLSGLGLDLDRSTLGTLLALDTGLAGRGAGSGLGLLGLLLALGSSLLILGVLDGLLASGGTGLGALGSSFLDHVKGSTDDSTLGLDDTATTLLGDFLFFISSVYVFILFHRIFVVDSGGNEMSPCRFVPL